MNRCQESEPPLISVVFFVSAVPVNVLYLMRSDSIDRAVILFSVTWYLCSPHP